MQESLDCCFVKCQVWEQYEFLCRMLMFVCRGALTLATPDIRCEVDSENNFLLYVGALVK